MVAGDIHLTSATLNQVHIEHLKKIMPECSQVSFILEWPSTEIAKSINSTKYYVDCTEDKGLVPFLSNLANRHDLSVNNIEYRIRMMTSKGWLELALKDPIYLAPEVEKNILEKLDCSGKSVCKDYFDAYAQIKNNLLKLKKSKRLPKKLIVKFKASLKEVQTDFEANFSGFEKFDRSIVAYAQEKGQLNNDFLKKLEEYDNSLIEHIAFHEIWSNKKTINAVFIGAIHSNILEDFLADAGFECLDRQGHYSGYCMKEAMPDWINNAKVVKTDDGVQLNPIDPVFFDHLLDPTGEVVYSKLDPTRVAYSNWPILSSWFLWFKQSSTYLAQRVQELF